MKDLMDKSSIIKLKEQGYSNRKVEKMLKINRKTIAKYWNEYQANIEKLNKLNELVSVEFRRKHLIVLDPEEKNEIEDK